MTTHTFKEITAWIIFVITWLILGLGSHLFENIINGKVEIFRLFLMGLMASCAYTAFDVVTEPSYYKSKSEKRASAILIQFIGIIIMTAYLLALFNRYSGLKHAAEKKYRVLDTGSNIKTRAKWIFLDIYGKRERFKLDGKDQHQYKSGDSVIVTEGKGALDMRFIEAIRPE